MKFLLKSLLILIFPSIVFGQEITTEPMNSLNNSILCHFSAYGKSDIAYLSSFSNDKAFSSKRYFDANIVYRIKSSDRLSFDLGIGFSDHNLEVQQRSTKSTFDISMVYIPITLQYHFSNVFYTKGGFQLTKQTKDSDIIDQQTGVALLFGLGVQLNLSKNLSAIIYPNTKLNRILPFGTSKTDRLFEYQMSVGLEYKL